MNIKARDLTCGVLFFTVGILMYLGLDNIPLIIENEVGSAFVPRLTAIALMCLAGTLIVLSLSKKAAAETAVSTDNKGGFLTIAALAAYVLLFDKLGFILATFLYLFAQMTILSDYRNRRLKLFGVISATASVTIYLLFVKALNLILPSGIWGRLAF